MRLRYPDYRYFKKPMAILVPCTESEYDAYLAAAIPAYAADKVASGQWSQDEALVLSRQSFEGLLPQGPATPDHYLFTIRDAADRAVGMIWLGTQDRAGQRIGFIYDVSIQPTHQRQGHATRAFTALEDIARPLGLSGIALHVFGHNPGAQALYAKLGYQITNLNMFKPLSPPARDSWLPCR